jgi:hypothetical protein
VKSWNDANRVEPREPPRTGGAAFQASYAGSIPATRFFFVSCLASHLTSRVWLETWSLVGCSAPATVYGRRKDSVSRRCGTSGGPPSSLHGPFTCVRGLPFDARVEGFRSLGEGA